MDYPKGVRPRNNAIEIRWQHKGRSYSETVDKTPTKANIQFAAKLRADRIFALKNGYASSAECPIFAEVAQDYLKSCELEYSTYKSYRDLLNKYWMPHLALKPINEIKRTDILEAINDFEFTSNKTKSNCYIPLRQVFKMALYDDLIDSNPVDKIKPVKYKKPPPDPFTPDEKETIINALTGQAKVYFIVAFGTGARTSELLGLKWQDYDGTKLTIQKGIVRGKKKGSTKNNKDRTVLLTKDVITALNSHDTRFKKGYIFCNTKGENYWDAKTMNRAFKKALDAHDIRYRRAYNARHTYATTGLMKGANPAFLANQLGHDLETFFKRYSTWINGDQDQLELSKLENTGQMLGKGNSESG